jgi:hypothetical protein
MVDDEESQQKHRMPPAGDKSLCERVRGSDERRFLFDERRFACP